MPKNMSKTYASRAAGFSLIELLVVVCIIACVLTLLFPRVWPLVEKSKNMKTLASCKAVSDSFMMYARLHGANPRMDDTYDTSSFTGATELDFESFLVPDFIKDVPEFDAWQYPFEYYYINSGGGSSFPDLTGDNIFMIRSAGSDGVFEGPSYEVGDFTPNLDASDPSFVSDDIVCADGEVIRWPGNWEQQP